MSSFQKNGTTHFIYYLLGDTYKVPEASPHFYILLKDKLDERRAMLYERFIKATKCRLKVAL